MPRASEWTSGRPDGCRSMQGDDFLAAELSEHTVAELGAAIRRQVVSEGPGAMGEGPVPVGLRVGNLNAHLDAGVRHVDEASPDEQVGEVDLGPIEPPGGVGPMVPGLSSVLSACLEVLFA